MWMKWRRAWAWAMWDRRMSPKRKTRQRFPSLNQLLILLASAFRAGTKYRWQTTAVLLKMSVSARLLARVIFAKKMPAAMRRAINVFTFGGQQSLLILFILNPHPHQLTHPQKLCS